MQYFLLVEKIEARPQLWEYLQSFLLAESLLRFDIITQSSPIAILINQIVIVGSSEHLNEFDDVGVRYFCQNIYLVVCEFAEFWGMLEFLHTHDLHCKKLPCFFVFSSIHITILSLPDALHQHIILHNLVHHHFKYNQLYNVIKYAL